MASRRSYSESPKKHGTKKARKSINLEEKMEVIRRMEGGEGRSNVCRALNLAPSTVTTIMKNSKKIKKSFESSVYINASKMTYSRGSVMENMEKLLVLWIDDMNQRNIPLTQTLIMDKARNLFNELNEEEGGYESFSASRGWFFRFKQRTKLHNVEVTREAESSDAEAAREFSAHFKRIVDEGKYPADIVFNVDETELYWKKLPSRTYISCEERSTSGFKAAKDRLTLLLGGNASGTLKLKPLLVYHSETPGMMKGIVKTHLPVIWRSNKKASMTQSIFSEWYFSYFCSTVAEFCTENNLPHKALLVLDNASGHPPNLSDIKSDVDVKVVFLPPVITSKLQPMDQGVMATFKAYYLRNIFQGIVQEMAASNTTVGDYWKSYDILKGIDYIWTAWDEVTQSCMNSVWCKLWPDCSIFNFPRFESVEKVSEEISMLAQEAGLDNVDPEDVTELLESHDQPLSKEDLEELAQQQKEEMEEEEEEHPIRSLSTKLIQEALTGINKHCQALCDNDPEWERSSSVKRGITTMLQPYYNFLRERRRVAKQMTLLQYFKASRREPVDPNDPQPGPSSQ